MMLNMPMDCRNEEFLCESISKFGKMRGWIREDPTHACTLIRCVYGNTGDISRSIFSGSQRAMVARLFLGQYMYTS
jgi:hypothetical protein